jgi:hypothetical protein
MIHGMFAPEALKRLLDCEDVTRILDIGSGLGLHADAMRKAGREVTTISMIPPADFIGDYLAYEDAEYFDAIWASHVLEHQPDVGAFLRKCFNDLRDDGVLAITVPPLKHNLVGGHVALFNQGILLYNLILAGFDCSEAMVSPVYANAPDQVPYNISVIVRKKRAELPAGLTYDAGDIEKLAKFFPVPVSQNCDGRDIVANWEAKPDKPNGKSNGNGHAHDCGPRVRLTVNGQAQPVMLSKADKQLSVPSNRKRPDGPEHVVLLALGPSSMGWNRVAEMHGGRRHFCDEVWTVNTYGDVFAHDLLWHMDDVRIQEARAKAGNDKIGKMLAWMKTHDKPIMTSRAHPDYPMLREFPLEDVINALNIPYFNGTTAYAVAYAIYSGVKKLTLFGLDFTYPNAHDAEKGRACVEFWCGQAMARGMDIQAADISTILDANMSVSDRLYGYDTVNVSIDVGANGKAKVRFTEKSEVVSAEEIEKRYDHTRLPDLSDAATIRAMIDKNLPAAGHA